MNATDCSPSKAETYVLGVVLYRTYGHFSKWHKRLLKLRSRELVTLKGVELLFFVSFFFLKQAPTLPRRLIAHLIDKNKKKGKIRFWRMP